MPSSRPRSRMRHRRSTAPAMSSSPMASPWAARFLRTISASIAGSVGKSSWTYRQRRRKGSGSCFSRLLVMSTMGRTPSAGPATWRPWPRAARQASSSVRGRSSMSNSKRSSTSSRSLGKSMSALSTSSMSTTWGLPSRMAWPRGSSLDVGVHLAGGGVGGVLGVLEAAQGVEAVEQVAGLAGALDGHRGEAYAQLFGDGGGEAGLAAAGLAFDQQRAAQADGEVDDGGGAGRGPRSGRRGCRRNPA